MAAPGKLDVEVELKSNADKSWKSIRESAKLFPKAMPDIYKSIDILEGDGLSVGSVRLIKFGQVAGESAVISESKERVDAVDEENKKVSYSVVGGDLLKYYKNYKCHLSVAPKGEGSLLKWGCEFEKVSEEVGVPHFIKDFAVKSFQALDSYNLKA